MLVTFKVFVIRLLNIANHFIVKALKIKTLQMILFLS